MSKQQKALARLLALPADYTWHELVSVMNQLGYRLLMSGGSSRKFLRDTQACMIHEPHPRKVLKPYQIKAVVRFLTEQGDIK